MHGACDCHMHLYDSRFPAAEGAALRPPDAPATAYRDLQAALGLARCVVVTPSTYGLDNRSTVAAMRRLRELGVEARGIAVLRSDVDEATLRDLHEAGVRGVRFNQTLGGTSLDDLEPLAARIAPLGWHVELLLPPTVWPGISPRLTALPVPFVLDHFGRLPHPGSEHSGHIAIVDLLRAGHGWVKLSGAYLSGAGIEACADDALRMTRALWATAPDRLVWGSNWPHPSVHAGIHQPQDDAALFDLLRRSLADEVALRRVLVDNPATLYGFNQP